MKKMKCAQEDYTEADLPETRKDVFVGCYKEHFSLLFKIGLLCLAFILPVIVSIFMSDFYIITKIEALQEKTQENMAVIYFTADLYFGLIQVFCSILFSVLFAGIVQILRQMLWDEPVFFGDDIKKGIKSNFLRFGIIVLLLSLANYSINLLSVSVLKYILVCILVVIILPVLIWVALQGVYYKLGVTASLRNAVLLYLKSAPVTLLLLVCTVIPFWLITSFISILLVKYLALIVLAVFYIVPLTMCWLLYGSRIFDKYINKEYYPQLYRKGMKKKDEEKQSQNMRSLY